MLKKHYKKQEETLKNIIFYVLLLVITTTLKFNFLVNFKIEMIQSCCGQSICVFIFHQNKKKIVSNQTFNYEKEFSKVPKIRYKNIRVF